MGLFYDLHVSCQGALASIPAPAYSDLRGGRETDACDSVLRLTVGFAVQAPRFTLPDIALQDARHFLRTRLSCMEIHLDRNISRRRSGPG